MHTDRDNRIRQRDSYTPNNHETPRQSRYQNFQRSHSSDDGSRSDSSRSRTPSPNPLVNICHACTGEHWLINCPDASRLERENELFKLMAKKKEQYAQRGMSWTPTDETKLRQEFKIDNLQNNPTIKHDQNKPAQGQGRYCKWEHIKGHATLLCPNFCPLCEKNGHGWHVCTAHKDLVDRRLANYRIILAKLAQPYTPYKRDTTTQKQDYRREQNQQPYTSRQPNSTPRRY